MILFVTEWEMTNLCIPLMWMNMSFAFCLSSTHDTFPFVSQSIPSFFPISFASPRDAVAKFSFLIFLSCTFYHPTTSTNIKKYKEFWGRKVLQLSQFSLVYYYLHHQLHDIIVIIIFLSSSSLSLKSPAQLMLSLSID